MVAAAVFLWGVVELPGCAKRHSLLKACVLPGDQAGTLSGHWRATPVPIAFHEGDFTAAEINQMTSAAETWNHFYGQSLNIGAIDYHDGSGAIARSTTPKPSSIS